MKKKDLFLDESTWRLFCRSNLNNALSELLNKIKSGTLRVVFWQIFFEEASMNDNASTKLKIIENLECIPEHIFDKITYLYRGLVKKFY